MPSTTHSIYVPSLNSVRRLTASPYIALFNVLHNSQYLGCAAWFSGVQRLHGRCSPCREGGVATIIVLRRRECFASVFLDFAMLARSDPTGGSKIG